MALLLRRGRVSFPVIFIKKKKRRQQTHICLIQSLVFNNLLGFFGNDKFDFHYELIDWNLWYIKRG